MRRLLWTLGVVLALCGVLLWSSGRAVRPAVAPVEGPRTAEASEPPATSELRHARPARESAALESDEPEAAREPVPQAAAAPRASPEGGPFLAGRVLLPDGSPAAADVVAYDENEQPALALVASRSSQERAAGRFRIQPLSGAGPYRVVATMGARFAQREGVEAGTSDLVLSLQSGRTIEGRVVDEFDRPLASFRVRGAPRPMRFGRALQAAGTDGVFRLEGLDEGTWDLRASAPGFVPDGDARVVVPPVEPVVLRMTRAVGVSGVVVDLAGAPLPFAEVAAQRAPDRDLITVDGTFRLVGPEKRVLAAEDGTFRFEGLVPGTWTLTAEHETARCGERHELQLAPGEGAEGLELVVGPGGTVQGTVVDEDGLPVAGAPVTVDGSGRSWNTRTDESGRFVVESLRPGPVTVSAVVAGLRAAREVRLAHGVTTEVLLDPPVDSVLRLHGRVLVDGGALEQGELSLSPGGDSLSGQSLATIPIETGAYAFRVASPGAYVLRLQARGFQHQWRIEVPDVPEHEHDLTIDTATIRGRVVDRSESERMAFATASLQTPDEFHSCFAGLQPDGSFTLRVAAGRNRVRAEQGGRHAEQEVVVTPGEVFEGLELRLE